MATSSPRSMSSSTAVSPRQRSFDELGEPLFETTFCVFDLETTGGSAHTAEITEIGAVKVRGGEILGTFQTLVNPGVPIPPFITLLTGITQRMVVQAPPIEGVLPAFLEFCTGTVLVGHNLRFDLSFLDAACDRLGYPRLSNRRVDTLALARRLVRSEVRSLSLRSLAAYFRSPVTPLHRALEDALATTHVLHGLLERAGTIGVTALEDLLTLPTAKGNPFYGKIDMARVLPRRPGVYLFLDGDGRVIYVGRAKNLRTRVMAYFHGDGRRWTTDMLRRLHRVDHIVCSGELEAAITELRLIWAHRPPFNRHLRPPRASHWVTVTNEEFPRISLTRTLHRDALAVLGPFPDRRRAEAVMHALWDVVPIRRCTGRPGTRSGPCTPGQLGVALCPCDGSLSPIRYRAAVEPLIEGIRTDPELLLAPLHHRMAELAAAQRFEQAAWVRDRYQALARTLEARRRWQALQSAGRIELASIDGERVVVDYGRLVASWREGEPRPPVPPPVEADPTPVPPSMAAAREAALIWRWMFERPVRITRSDGPLDLPVRPVKMLKVG